MNGASAKSATPKASGKHVATLSDEIEKTLRSWGFQHSVRHCLINPLKYGVSEGSYTVEEWSNADLARIIAEDLTNSQGKDNQ